MKKRCNDTNSLTKNDTSDKIITDTESVEIAYEDYLKQRVEEEFETSYHSGVKNINSFKNGIRNNLIKDGIEYEFKIITLLSKEKEKLKSKITDNQPYKIILRHKTDIRENLYFNSDFLLIKFDNSKHSTSKFETLQTIRDFEDEYIFDINKCGDGDEFIVGRI